MSYLLRLLGAVIIVVGGNYLVASFFPPVRYVLDERLLSIFPPIWENSLNVNEISFGWTTAIFLIFLFFFSINLKKIETKNPFTDDLCVLLLSSGLIFDGTYIMSITLLTFYVTYILWVFCDDDDSGVNIPVVFFAVALLSFSAFIIYYRNVSPNLISESLIVLLVLFSIRLIKRYYSNNKKENISLVN